MLETIVDLSLATLRFFAPALLFFIAGFRQHRLWVVVPYALIIAPLTIMVKNRTPYSRDPNMGNFSQGPVLDFLGFVLIIAIIGGVAFLIARYIGRFFKRPLMVSNREQWLFLAVFAGMYAVLHIVVFFYGIERMPL